MWAQVPVGGIHATTESLQGCMVSALPCRSSGRKAGACSMQHGLASAMVPERSASLPHDILELLFTYQLSEPTPIVLTAYGGHYSSLKEADSRFSVRQVATGFMNKRYLLCIKKKQPAWSRFKNLEAGVVSRSSFQAGLRPCRWCSAFCCVLQPPSTQCSRCCPCCAIHVCHRCCCFPAGKTTTTMSCLFHFLFLQSFFP